MKRNSIIIVLIMGLIQASGTFAQDNWGPAEWMTLDDWWIFCPGNLIITNQCVSSNDSVLFITYECDGTPGTAYSVFQNNEWVPPYDILFNTNFESGPLFYYAQLDTILYFTAETDSGFGGYGDKDIWAVHYANGNWEDPYNLGPVINTAGEEISPSVQDDGSRLYFSRDSVLMYSEIVNGQFLNPIELPPVINGEYYERYPRISNDGRRLYFNKFISPFNIDSLMVSSLTNGVWSDPVSLNGNINFNHNNPDCSNIPGSSYGPSFTVGGQKMYFSRFEPMGAWCEPGFGIMVSELITDIDEDLPQAPSNFSLSAYPNPFNSTTNISINGNLESISEIAIYDITGRMIKSFEPAPLIAWDGTDSRGESVSSGIYFVKVIAGDIEKSVRITLLK